MICTIHVLGVTTQHEYTKKKDNMLVWKWFVMLLGLIFLAFSNYKYS